MRTDDSTARESFRKSENWAQNPLTGETNQVTDQRMFTGDQMTDGKLVVHSLSGNERNHFFLNQDAGREFTNTSAISGMDSEADGRGFCLLDYDGDGWQDVAVVNANAPLLQLYHNDIAKMSGVKAGMIAIRFRGGNTTAAASAFGNRDGYGAKVNITLSGGVQLMREHRCGEGFAAENSATLIIGIGDRAGVESVSVRWPSGQTIEVKDVAEGTLLTAWENREAGAFEQQPYRNARKPAGVTRTRVKFPLARSVPGKVQVFTTTATWCAACLQHLPDLAALAQDDVALYGVPVDPEDDTAKLAAYIEKAKPAYQMLAGTTTAEKDTVSAFLAQALQIENPALPSSVITDDDGNILQVMPGVPTLSQVRKWQAAGKH